MKHSEAAHDEAARLQASYSPLAYRRVWQWQVEHPIDSPEAQAYLSLYVQQTKYGVLACKGALIVQGYEEHLDRGRVVFSLERREG